MLCKGKLAKLLQTEVTPALGCTEPVAIALASAKARSLVGGEFRHLKLVLSPNIFKNAKAVGIPMTERTGVDLAAMFGVSLDQPTMDLTVFSQLTEEVIKTALARLAAAPPEIIVEEDLPGVYIDVWLQTDAGSSRVTIADHHTNFVYLEQNGEVLLDLRGEAAAKDARRPTLGSRPIAAAISDCLKTPPAEFEFLLEGIQMNLAVARAGLELETGLRFGRRWQRLKERGLITDDLTSTIALYTAAACDARMSGIKLPVMSSAGSGNHGLVAILPIAMVSEHLQSPESAIVKALALSHLITLYIKEFTGRLSPICGCAVAAGAGASAGITYLLDGDEEAIQRAITNVVSNLAGMLCDGGKVGCALKLATSAVTAWWSSLLALEGLTVPPGNGFVGATLDDTIAGLGALTKQGMEPMDRSIVALLRRNTD